jgi:Pectinacetylesterase
MDRTRTHTVAAGRLACTASLAAALAMLAAACSSSSSGSSTAGVAAELAASGFGDYLGVQAPSRSEAAGAWTNLFFDPAEEQAICLLGTEYEVSVHHGTSDQVLIYLQGGGACWDYLSCYVLRTAFTTSNGAGEIGIIDLDDARNPFRDYNVVYASYCDGSVFTGDATVDYDGNRTFHHGLRNLTVAIDAAVREFPDPSRIVVAGSSAGGYGTFAGYGVARVAYPDTEIVVFNDSGPGVQNLDATEDVQNRVRNWNFTSRIPETCTECDEQYTFLLDWAFERDPLLRVAMYSYQRDGVISGFIDLSGPAYEELLLGVTGELHRRNPERFQRFFPKGTQHTILQYPEFYSLAIRGSSIRDWTAAFLDDGAGWTDTIE